MVTKNLNRLSSAWRVLSGLLDAARPEYWLKPLAVMWVASTYALGDFPDLSRFLYGFLIVGPMLWGGLYILNDITDKNEHSQHPLKRFRPFSAGIVDVQTGTHVSALMIGLALLLGLPLGIPFTSCLLLMCLKQLAYCLPGVRLKEKFFWDVVSGSLGNASLRFAAGWFLFSNSLEMPLLLLFFGECLQLAGFFVNRLHANYGSGIERRLQYASTTANLSAGRFKVIIAICGGAAMISFILLSLNGHYHILPEILGQLPVQSLVVFAFVLFCLPFLARTVRLAERFSAWEARFYYAIPMLIAFVGSILLSFILKHYG
jgi:4-hydroxybenzoate polyprenyltransferase